MPYFENGLTLPVDVQALVPQENRDAAIRQHVPPPAICCRQLSEHFDELVRNTSFEFPHSNKHRTL
jgi:hypothetical protein